MRQQEDLIRQANREDFFIMLYKKVFPSLAKYIHKRGGTLDEAKDIFQDSIVIYYEKLLAPGFTCHNEKAYLMGVAKHLWLHRFNNLKTLPLDESLQDIIATEEEQQHSTNKLLQYLETAGQKCLQLLSAFYFDQMPVQEIAGWLGYSGVRSATVQKYKCLEKVRETVKQKALQYEDFVE